MDSNLGDPKEGIKVPGIQLILRPREGPLGPTCFGGEFFTSFFLVMTVFVSRNLSCSGVISAKVARLPVLGLQRRKRGQFRTLNYMYI